MRMMRHFLIKYLINIQLRIILSIPNCGIVLDNDFHEDQKSNWMLKI